MDESELSPESDRLRFAVAVRVRGGASSSKHGDSGAAPDDGSPGNTLCHVVAFCCWLKKQAPDSVCRVHPHAAAARKAVHRKEATPFRLQKFEANTHT